MSSYKKISSKIQQIIIDNPATPDIKLKWLNISAAGKQELEYLRKNFKFNFNHLQASLSKTSAQRPSFTHNESEQYIFLILLFPILKNNKIVAGEIDFFIKKGLMISIHSNDFPEINSFFNYCKKDTTSLIAYKYESASILLYGLLKKLIEKCFILLDQNSIKIAEIEELIFAQEQKEAVAKILMLRRDIINFRKIIQNHKNIFKKQMEREGQVVTEEIKKKYFSELIGYTKTIWEILDNQKEMLDVLNDTNESLFNNRLNEIIKTLTIFSVIVFPLTLLAAIFGMNIEGMPFVNTPNGFWIIIAIMATGCLGMLLFFEKKKWL